MDLVEAKARGFDEPVRHWWERARVRLALDLVRAHGRLSPGDVVLDVGCGDTFVVEHCARVCPQVMFYAVDSAFTPELIAAFRRRLRVPNVRLFSSLGDVPRERPARLVLLMDVLEHVADDVAMLRDIEARVSLMDDCRFLITVPAYQQLFSSHDTFLGHYRRYTRRMLRQTMTAARLTPVVDGYLFASLLPLRYAQVLREKLFGVPHGATTDLATWKNETLAHALSAVLVAEGRVVMRLARRGIRVPGLSVVAVCEKSA
ncbi:MAG: class I SAM-dependent methyltransferase [Acidobacteriaceae bacterium]|jgi:SAM-dependent methyltransferase|nr:class I SAM-dependent methyltransferase [Acidobacteriaceae bacterium]